jgi:hypothetical protein
MLQDILKHGLVNVSFISKHISVSRQALHELRKYGTGVSVQKQSEILEYLRKELNTLSSLTNVNKPDKSKLTIVKESEIPDKSKLTNEKQLIRRIKPKEWEALSKEDRKRYEVRRGGMGDVYYVLGP